MVLPRTRVRSIELQAICHATESPEKVLQALLNLVPPDIRGKIRVEESVAKGHHGNPIRIISASLKGEEAEDTAKWIFGRLSESDLRLLELSLDRRIDRSGHLYLRIDKQEAYLGRMMVGSGGDVIRVVISVRGGRPKEVVRSLAGVSGEAR
jgi:RNA binding exosome subunit